MDVSIIIVNWNTRDFIHDCLKSIYEETKDVEFEVIVIDNASTDGSAKMIKTDFPQVRLLENRVNNGFAAANIQGMAIAKGRYFLLLNPDTIILDNAISKIFTFANKHPEAAIVGCRTLDQGRTLLRNCFRYPSLLNIFLNLTFLDQLFPKNKFFGRKRMAWWQYDDVREVEVVAGCFMFTRKKAVDEVGMMDERFFMYAEEADWCYRFNNAGWKILFTPIAEIMHYQKKSSEQIRLKAKLQLSKSQLLFIKKHNMKLKYILACFIMGLFFASRLPYWVIRSISPVNRKEALLQAKTCLMGLIGALTGGGKIMSMKK